MVSFDLPGSVADTAGTAAGPDAASRGVFHGIIASPEILLVQPRDDHRALVRGFADRNVGPELAGDDAAVVLAGIDAACGGRHGRRARQSKYHQGQWGEYAGSHLPHPYVAAVTTRAVAEALRVGAADRADVSFLVVVGGGTACHIAGMTQRQILTMLLSVCGVLLIVGFVFSSRIEQGITHAAQIEATQQSPVPTPAGFATAPHKAS